MIDAWSITDGYHDVQGEWHPTPDHVRAALRAAMRAEGDEPPPPAPMWFVGAGEAHPLQGRCDLALEDGTVLTSLTGLPPDLPLGYHELRPLDGGSDTRLVVTPRRCPLPERQWGWVTQLYALRSHSSWGMGDLGDLAALSSWSRSLGAGTMMISPLHANPPVPPQQPSPYFATSRIWRNVLHLRIADIPGASALGHVLGPLDRAGRDLNHSERIDRDAVLALKIEALEHLFTRFLETGHGRAAFDAWRSRQDSSLRPFATYCALAERLGQNYKEWPEEYRSPASHAVAAFADAEDRRIELHEWCQWHLANQLERAGASGVALISDIAVGFDPCGADGWVFQDLVAEGCRVGAPPDLFSVDGQDWGLPPFVPWRLRAARYEPFVATIRSALLGCGGIRLDHVMGLFRLYWVSPEGNARDGGAYVRYPAGDLLDLIALEAHRAGAFVVGEDLGTVEDEVRDKLADRNVLSYRLLWFSEGDVGELPRQALAAVTTHDLPTIAGVWGGSDQAARIGLGLAPPGEDDPIRPRLLELAEPLADGTRIDDVVVRTYERLGASPCLVLLGTLEDAVAMPERPNFPGTIDEWPNWRIPLPVTLDALAAHPLVQQVAATLAHGAAHPPPERAGDHAEDEPE
jgi:4-alpha-glucanotransferase